MKLRFSPRAERQLASIFRHIEKDNPAAALRVIANIKSAARLLTAFPESGREGSASRTREWVVHGLPYVIVYRFDRKVDELAVIAVIHGAQRG